MRRATYTYYQAADGWRWRLAAANGRIVASGEGYTRRGDVLRAIRTHQRAASTAHIKEG